MFDEDGLNGVTYSSMWRHGHDLGHLVGQDDLKDALVDLEDLEMLQKQTCRHERLNG